MQFHENFTKCLNVKSEKPEQPKEVLVATWRWQYKFSISMPSPNRIQSIFRKFIIKTGFNRNIKISLDKLIKYGKIILFKKKGRNSSFFSYQKI